MQETIDFGAYAKKAYHEALGERGRVNVLIAGRTGVGKSTLVNAVFEDELATTGQGRPVTTHTREYTKADSPLSVFDTRGLEMADFAKTMTELRAAVSAKNHDSDAQKHIHVGWVCVEENLRRVESAEIDLTAMLAEYMPVIAVVTKAQADQGFRAKVQELLPQSRNVVRVRAIREVLDDGHVLEPMGLEQLVSLTIEVIPEGQRRAFTAAQKVDIALKKNRSHLIVATAAVSAAGIAVVPIPFSDWALIVPVQISMLAGITATFGVSFNEGFLSSLVASVVGGSGATVTGRTISGLLKLIPGIGTVVGGAISAATAAGVTTALGEAYIATLEILFMRHNGEPPTAGEVLKTFEEQYAKLTAR